MLGSTRSHILTPLLIMCLINCYDVHIETMFGFYLPTVVCRRAHVLSTLFVFADVKWYLTRIDRLSGMALSCGRRELLSLRWCLGSPPILGQFMLLNVLVFCQVFSWFVCLRPVFCVPNVTSFSGLSILDCHFGFC
jgi:hypothetical protein